MIVAREQVEKYYGIPKEEKRKKPSPVEKRHLSRRSRLLYTGLIVLTFITGVIISFYYAQVFITNYRIHSLQKQLAVLQKETDNLYSDINQLTSLERIEQVAVNKLGMVRPGETDVVKIAMKNDQPADPVKAGATAEGRVAAQAENHINDAKENVPQGEQNWVIQAFSNLVKRVEQGVPSR